jgi:hypothetical protein
MNVKVYKNKGSVYIEIDGGNADQIAKKFADALTDGFVTELKGLMPVSDNDFVAIPAEAVQEYPIPEKWQNDTKQEEPKSIMPKPTEEKQKKESIPKSNESETKSDSESNEGYDESLFI